MLTCGYHKAPHTRCLWLGVRRKARPSMPAEFYHVDAVHGWVDRVEIEWGQRAIEFRLVRPMTHRRYA